MAELELLRAQNIALRRAHGNRLVQATAAGSSSPIKNARDFFIGEGNNPAQSRILLSTSANEESNIINPSSDQRKILYQPVHQPVHQRCDANIDTRYKYRKCQVERQELKASIKTREAATGHLDSALYGSSISELKGAVGNLQLLVKRQKLDIEQLQKLSGGRKL